MTYSFSLFGCYGKVAIVVHLYPLIILAHSRHAVALEDVRGLRLSENEVRYSLGVKRFVEVSSMLHVKPVNVPSDKIMNVYPSVVKVTLRCQFPLVEDPFSGLRIEADYNDYQKSLGGKATLKPVGLSHGVIDVDVDPIAVSCVIEDR